MKTNNTIIGLLIVIGLTVSVHFQLNAQPKSMLGLWGVELVMVGNKEVTPVAKWFRFHEDMTCEAGNGWTQNLIGTYTFNKGIFKPTNKNQPLDPFGPFEVTFEGSKMYWEREEEGMNVKVTLSPITKLPAAPADLVIGLWDLKTVEKEGENITKSYDKDELQYINIGWTRQYDMRQPNGEQTRGFWHMDAHDPRLSLVNYDKNIPVRQYIIYTIGNDILIMESETSKTKFTYQRIMERPS